MFAGDFDGYFLPFVGKQGIFITFYVVTGVFKILGVNRNIISKDEIGGITLGIKRNYYEVSVISHMCAGTQKRFNKKTIQKLESVLEISIPDISNDAEAIIKDMEEGQTI